jgi:hypothetical protein
VTLLVTTVMAAFEMEHGNSWLRTPAIEPRSIDSPTDLLIIAHQRDAQSMVMRITGTLRNAGVRHWTSVTLTAHLYSEGVNVNKCYTYLEDLSLTSKQDMPFILECEDVLGANWPSNLRYQLSIRGEYLPGRSGAPPSLR